MAKKKTCPKCGGSARGRGYSHEPSCADYKGSTSKASTSSGGFRIDGRTSIPNLLKWQGEIQEQLESRDKAEVRRVKKAIEELEGLRAKLREAEKLAGW
jgi:hypothetical protein